jgi:hypothetical protein
VTIDEFGERLKIQTEDLARIVSKEGLIIDNPPSEVNHSGEEGEKPSTPVIPLPDLYNVYYFQYRIDNLDP